MSKAHSQARLRARACELATHQTTRVDVLAAALGTQKELSAVVKPPGRGVVHVESVICWLSW